MTSSRVSALLSPAAAPPPSPAASMVVEIDSGSRGVSVRAGAAMHEVIRTAHERSGFTPATIRGERVIVRQLRAARQRELELNPVHAWRVHVHAPTWNTRLDLLGLDVRGIQVDSGAARVECVLPPPRGVVPIRISSGVVGVRLRRPPEVAVIADVSPGSLNLRLDDATLAATTADSRWTSRPDAAAGDHYTLKISGGTVRVSLEVDPTLSGVPPRPVATRLGVAAALEVLLDGVAARAKARA